MSDRPKMIQEWTTPREAAAHDLLAQAIEGVQRLYHIDSLTFSAILGAAIGEMIAQADVGSEAKFRENAFPLREDQMEPLKQTILVNFDAAYNRVRSELAEPIKPKKGVI